MSYESRTTGLGRTPVLRPIVNRPPCGMLSVASINYLFYGNVIVDIFMISIVNSVIMQELKGLASFLNVSPLHISCSGNLAV